MSKPTPRLSMDQLVAELREALPDIDDGGVRKVEVAEALGWFTQVNIFDSLIPRAGGARKPET